MDANFKILVVEIDCRSQSNRRAEVHREVPAPGHMLADFSFLTVNFLPSVVDGLFHRTVIYV